MGNRRKARECALQMLFAIDLSGMDQGALIRDFWNELSEYDLDDSSKEFADIKEFANILLLGTLQRLKAIDDKIRNRAEHWRIERMAIVDRNILRLAVNEFLFRDTPHTVIINEALEIARRFSTYEATQFINGILDAIKCDLEEASEAKENESLPKMNEKTKASSP